MQDIAIRRSSRLLIIAAAGSALAAAYFYAFIPMILSISLALTGFFVGRGKSWAVFAVVGNLALFGLLLAGGKIPAWTVVPAAAALPTLVVALPRLFRYDLLMTGLASLLAIGAATAGHEAARCHDDAFELGHFIGEGIPTPTDARPIHGAPTPTALRCAAYPKKGYANKRLPNASRAQWQAGCDAARQDIRRGVLRIEAAAGGGLTTLKGARSNELTFDTFKQAMAKKGIQVEPLTCGCVGCSSKLKPGYDETMRLHIAKLHGDGFVDGAFAAARKYAQEAIFGASKAR